MKKQRQDVPVKKNEDYTLLIEDISTSGEGIGKIKGYTLFVKGALPGDHIKAKVIKTKKNYGFGKLLKILKPSKKRVEPVCGQSKRCGGCQLLHFDYNAQLEFKRSLVKNNLERIGGLTDITVLPTLGMEEPYFYRNKVQYPVGFDKQNQPLIGFYAMRSHDIIEAEKCYIQSSTNEQIVEKVREYLKESPVSIYDEVKHTGLLRHLVTRIGYHTKEIMVCLVINGDQLPNVDHLINKLKTIPNMTSIVLNINKKRSNVILGDRIEVLWGKEAITDRVGDIEYKISPLSFYQVNPIQTKKLYDKVVEFANPTGDERVWDVYCGIGTIGLYLANHVKKVYGVEIIPQAIENAKENAVLNHIENASFYVGKAEEVLPAKLKYEGLEADLIILDPPRKGCDQVLLDTLIHMQPPKIIYVSCDPATLARDLKRLTEGGYTVEEVQPVDMFPQTTHVETVVKLNLTL